MGAVSDRDGPEDVAEPGSPAFAARLERLVTRLDQRRSRAEEPSLEAVSDAETAYEELRVADAEVRAQQDEIAGLVQRHRQLQAEHDRLMASLPLAVLVTSRDGTIVSANAGAAALSGRNPGRLVGKPVFVLFDPGERRALRDALARSVSAGGRTETGVPVVSVVSVAGTTTPVQVALGPDLDDPDRVVWTLLTASDTGHPDRAARDRSVDLAGVVPVLAELVALPARQLDRRELLTEAAGLCARALRAEHVSIALGPPDAPEALASTSQAAQALDGAQVVTGEGPSVDAHARRAAYRSPDLTVEARWPKLAAAVSPAMSPDGPAPTGVLAVPVELGGRLLGVLTVYGDAGRAGSAAGAAELLAASLGAMLFEHDLQLELAEMSTQLRSALQSRATIDQAKGIVMAQRHCTPDEAFAHLQQLASDHEVKLRDVARVIVETASS